MVLLFDCLAKCVVVFQLFSEILGENSESKVAEIVEAARTSIGMDISEIDLLNIDRFSNRIAALTDFRQNLNEYIKERMASCAPSLSALVGEQVSFNFVFLVNPAQKITVCVSSIVCLIYSHLDWCPTYIACW